MEVLLLSLEVMGEEARVFGLEINWDKTKILTNTDRTSMEQRVQTSHGDVVEIVDVFTYIGSQTVSTGSSEPEIRLCIEIARSCMTSLDKGIW